MKVLHLLHRFVLLIAGLIFMTQITLAQDQDQDQEVEHESYSTAPFNHLLTGPFSEEGSVLKIGGRALFFEGLTEQDAAHVYNSIVYGGVVPAVMSKLLSLGGNKADHMGLERLALLLQLAESVAYPIHLYYGLNDLIRMLTVGTWYSLPYFSHVFLPNQYTKFTPYGMAALLYTLGTLRNVFTQSISSKNTQYVHIPLGGSASRKFFIKALFLDEPVYTLSHIGQNEANDEGDVFSHLSRVLGTYNIDFLTIKPLRDQDSSMVQVIFHNPNNDENTTIHVKGWSDEHDNSTWLLHSIHEKRNRFRLTAAKSALAPSLLSATASAIEMLFMAQKQATQGVLEKIEAGRYLFTPSSDSQVASKISSIEHQKGGSEFVMGDRELVYQWSDGYFWPKLRLVPALSGDQELTQWWIPDWLGRLLVAESADKGRRLAYKTINNFSDRYVMPHLLTTPVRRVRAFFSQTNGLRVLREPVSDDVHFNLALIANRVDPNNLDHCSYCYDELTNEGLYKSPCCQQVYLCPTCQQTWSRQQYEAGRFVLDADALPSGARRGDLGVRLNCMIPACREGIPTVICGGE